MSFFQLFEHFNVYVLDPFKGKFMMIRFVIFHNWSQLVNSLRGLVFKAINRKLGVYGGINPRKKFQKFKKFFV